MTAPPPRSMARLKAFQSRTLSSGDRMKSGVMVWLRCSCSLPLSCAFILPDAFIAGRR